MNGTTFWLILHDEQHSFDFLQPALLGILENTVFYAYQVDQA
jgi:hypothetical protein